jgi:formate dehydrogenase maturation protein FdhE
MKNQLIYFDEKAEKIQSAGLLTDAMISFYHDLFAYHQKFCGQYSGDSRLPTLQATDLPLAENGKKIFTTTGIGELLLPGLTPLMEIITSSNSGLELKPLHRALSDDTGAIVRVADAVLDMDTERLEQFALSCKVGPDEAIFVIVNWLKPFFINLKDKNSTIISDKDDTHHCPFCGSHPDMAALVTGMDGKRFLHCSLCGHRWQYRRIACAVCGTEDASNLEYFSSDEDTRYRLDVCTACGGYMKTMKLDKFEEIDDFDLAVENILTVHLDSAAIQKGYKKP